MFLVHLYGGVEVWGVERGGDDGGHEAARHKQLGHVNGGQDVSMSHEGKEENVERMGTHF